MRPIFRMTALASVLAIGGLGLGTSSAQAQGYGYGGYGGGYDGGGYGGGYGNGGYGGGYGGSVPSYNYYGNGGHDAVPHAHTTQTPFGSFNWYGSGAHDYQPHAHTETPYGIQSYSGGLFTRTQSYAPASPYIYRPW